MNEGEQLRLFIDNQKISKQKIAEDLKMSRQNLFQFFKSKTLSDETKKKIEQYFKASIFTGQGPLIKTTKVKLNEENTTMATIELIESLRSQIKILENHCGFLQKTYEDKIIILEANLMRNQKYLEAVMAQIRAASRVSAERFAGNDKEKLNESLRKLDKYVSEFLAAH